MTIFSSSVYEGFWVSGFLSAAKAGMRLNSKRTTASVFMCGILDQDRQLAEQKITFTNGGAGFTAFPVKVCALIVPAGVNVCVWVLIALPVKVWALVVLDDPLNVGTPTGHATVPDGVKDTVPFVPVAVRVCVCVASAEPVNVSAGTVRFGAVALQAVVDPVPAAILVAAQLPEVAVAPLVPAGVPALTALVVAELPVKV